ncbi:response regulator transcription factor [Aquibacillus kalidii]|uniref:response regulator transcription factor n=1 Tax=Aquibacillus kalidii TaxID=2762597 RepID=UPI001644D0BB|nr:helix-turn-helix domain-containing protein [Aquibacillus kalidii]
MYKVMLVDDDYPALEFLSEMVEWDSLGLQLQSTHENGLSALENAQLDMPDILITDIGMPKMDGIQLTQKLKEKNPNLQVVILSCHNEFKYAQKAIKLNVQDYILKETLDPDDLSSMLLTYKERLDNEQKRKLNDVKMKNQLKKNEEFAKSNFLREIIYHSNRSQDWYGEHHNLGFHLKRANYMPILCVMDNYLSAKQLYTSVDTLQFVAQNVINEIIEETNSNIIYMSFEENKSFILYPVQQTLKENNYENAQVMLKKIQYSFSKYLNISVSFLIGEYVTIKELKGELKSLLSSNHQRFYMDTGSITRKLDYTETNKEDLFSWYDEASMELRNLIFEQDLNSIRPTISKWTQFIKEKEFSLESVKEWFLKLLLELKVKMQALQYFQSSFNVEALHQEILYIDNLHELKEWIINYFHSLINIKTEVTDQSKHKEIMDACVYVTKNIEKKLCLDEVASHLFLNPSYFSRLFKKEMKKTFVEYVTSVKIERAKELLDQTTEPIGKICERLGYDNQSYFIKLFKNHLGCTPSDYRRSKA